MPRTHFLSLMGLAGVSKFENDRAVRAARLCEPLMVLLALWLIVLWYLDTVGQVSNRFVFISDCIIWLFFIAETCWLTALVDDRWQYLKSNWVNLLIILMGIPIVLGWDLIIETGLAGWLRLLRLLLVLSLITGVSSTFQAVLGRNHLGITLAFTLVVIVFSGFIIAGIDPGITSVSDGIWWALVTVATVGYGDIVPVSIPGRAFGAFLILLGLGVIAMLTANISAIFVARDEEKIVRREEIIQKRTHEILRRLESLDERFKRIEHLLAGLETKEPADAGSSDQHKKT